MYSINALKSASQAEHYYEHDDYYRESGESPSAWLGRGAQMLGAEGEVDREQLRELLEGQMPDGTLLGTKRGGEWQHRPGYDVTLSAPKSVSVMALAGGDERLVAAHDRAVAKTFAYMEREAAQTRIREAGEIRTENTGNLIGASFRHATSREQDPQLHSHCLVINATQSEDGQWRSIESRELFRIARSANEVYSQELAREARALGYDIHETRDGWELASVPDNVRDSFSGRKKAIDAWLEAHGYDRETASREIKERATLATRAHKEKGIDRDELAQSWHDRAQTLGYSPRDAVRAAAARNIEQGALADEGREAAAEAVRSAAASLSERQSRFTVSDLHKEALRNARGSAATLGDIEAAVVEKERGGDLLRRQVETINSDADGYTTRDAIRIERGLLASESAGRGAVAALMNDDEACDAVERAASSSEYGWTKGQREAARGILTSENRVTAIQGYAGTAKTTTVLKSVAEEAKARGLEVVGMAPTASAADQLAEGAGVTQSDTVAAHLGRMRAERGKPEAERDHSNEIWIVDESSMMSAKDTRDLLRAAERSGARVVLVGDVQQLGSVEAGEAFLQLQEGGMQTHVLDDIVRQRDAHAREAVYHSIDGDAAKAMQAIERSGEIKEIAGDDKRLDAVARDYLALSAADRAKTIVLDPTRAGREELNAKIRDGLRVEGAIGAEDRAAKTLDKKDLTQEQSKQAGNYKEGDIVRFSKDYEKAGIEKGAYYTVERVDHKAKTVHLASGDGERVAWQPAKFGGGKSSEAFEERQAALAVGDRLQWTKNDKDSGLKNGDRLRVQQIEGDKALVKDQRGRVHNIDLAQRDGQHWRHSYASTVHAAQGRTADRVLVSLSKDNKQLLSQRSFYTAASRAKDRIQIYTDDRSEIEGTITRQAGIKQTALEGTGQRTQAQRQARKSEARTSPAASRAEVASRQTEQRRQVGSRTAKKRRAGDSGPSPELAPKSARMRAAGAEAAQLAAARQDAAKKTKPQPQPTKAGEQQRIRKPREKQATPTPPRRMPALQRMSRAQALEKLKNKSRDRSR